MGRIPPVNMANHQLPDVVREQIAENMVTPGTPENVALTAGFARLGGQSTGEVDIQGGTPLTLRAADGTKHVDFKPDGVDPHAHVVRLFPPSAGKRTKIEFWSGPEEDVASVRAASLETHGTADPYNPESQHVSLYTVDNVGAFRHAFDLYWGSQFDGKFHLPDLLLYAEKKAIFVDDVSIGNTTGPSPTSAGRRVLDIAETVDGAKELEIRLRGTTYASRWLITPSNTTIGNDTSKSLTLYVGSAANNNIHIPATGNNVGFGTSSFGGGAKVLGIANATTVPTTNPSAGGILYVESGALKYRGSSGTVTTLAPA